MSKAPRSAVMPDGHIEQAGPTEFHDAGAAREIRKAAIWIGMVMLAGLVVLLAHPIMLIIGGLVFSVILDGGTRLLGRILPIGRGWRLAIVCLSAFAFIAWVFYFAGTTLATQAEALRAVITIQFERMMEIVEDWGLLPGGQPVDLTNQMLGGIGRLTTALSTAVGAVTSVFMIVIIGIFVAIEPKLYDRSVAWMLPLKRRAKFYAISERVGFVLRRLMMGRIIGMVVEGVGTWLLLMWAGVPMAALLGLLTGLLAFIPNIGALISGLLMVAVGFSAGTETGLWAIAIYFIVQNVDGYLIMPYVARKTVDLAPALVLGAQLLFGALFGILGLFLADPIVATIKTALQEFAARKSATGPAEPAPAEAAADLREASPRRRRRAASSSPRRARPS